MSVSMTPAVWCLLFSGVPTALGWSHRTTLDTVRAVLSGSSAPSHCSLQNQIQPSASRRHVGALFMSSTKRKGRGEPVATRPDTSSKPQFDGDSDDEADGENIFVDEDDEGYVFNPADFDDEFARGVEEGGEEQDEWDDEDLPLASFPVAEEEVYGVDDPEGRQIDHWEQQAEALKKLGPPRPIKGKRRREIGQLPVVAIIGRPNVGKSTVVNRLARTFHDGSIVFDQPGVTRDRTYKKAFFGEYDFEVVDTGGLVFDDDDDVFSEQVRQQAMIALDEASAAIMVTDGQSGLTQLDEEIARFLRQQKVPVYLAVNKCESSTVGDTQAAEFWQLGLGNPWPVSGLHGYGLGDLLEAMSVSLHKVTGRPKEDDTVNVAIVGRPNVGKSSLLNKLFGEDRAIVSDVAGTTRDTIDAMFERGNRTYRLIDTAGVRRKKKVEYGNEFFMINRAFKAIRRADVVLLVLDASEGIKDQDRVLAQRISDEGRACVVVCNKWDAVADKNDKTFNKAVDYIREELPVVRWAEQVFTSAITGQRTTKIFDLVDDAVVQHRKRVRTSVLNECLRDAILWQSPPTRKKSQQGKIYYCNQVATRPPTVAIFCNTPKLFSDNYKRYLERKFREQLGFKSTPLKFVWRGKRVRRMEQERSKSHKPYADA